MGVLAEMLASTMNPNAGGANHAAVYVEQQVLNWLKEMLNYPAEASGTAVPSYTTLNGRYMLRAAITNHRSRRADFEMMVEKVAELGRDLLSDP
jgi:hypothetical protein